MVSFIKMNYFFFVINILLLHYCNAIKVLQNVVFDKKTNQSYTAEYVEIIGGSGVLYNGLLEGTIEELTIKKSNITEVEDGALCNSEILRLEENIAFPKLTPQMFKSCQNLTTLILANVTIVPSGFFEVFPNLQAVYLKSTDFTSDDNDNGSTISAETFKGLRARVLEITDPKPRKFSDDAFSNLENLGFLSIICSDSTMSPEFSPYTFMDLKVLEGLALRNISWAGIKWHEFEEVYTFIMCGPNTPENSVVFLKNLKTYFPKLESLEMQPDYYSKEQQKNCPTYI